jgi:hypothetical protein
VVVDRLRAPCMPPAKMTERNGNIGSKEEAWPEGGLGWSRDGRKPEGGDECRLWSAGAKGRCRRVHRFAVVPEAMSKEDCSI